MASSSIAGSKRLHSNQVERILKRFKEDNPEYGKKENRSKVSNLKKILSTDLNEIELAVGEACGKKIGSTLMKCVKQELNNDSVAIPLTTRPLLKIDVLETHSDECNGVLLVLETIKPKRIWLRIADAETDNIVSADVIVTLAAEDFANLHHDIVSIDKLVVIGRFRVFIAKFSTTSCSNAREADFLGAKIQTSEITDISGSAYPFYKKLDNTQLGWTFFTLGDTTMKSTDTFLAFKDNIKEADRISSLRTALSRGINIKDIGDVSCEVTHLDDRNHYCQFSGGGDLYFKLAKTPTVVLSNAANLDSDITVSPRYEDDLRGNSIIEGKKAEVDNAALKYQLMANMVIACTKNFIDKLDNREIDEDALQRINKISCYGIAFTGSGTFGLLKLEINFSQNSTIFSYKIPLKNYMYTSSAALFDLSIAYISKQQSSLPTPT